MTGGWLRTGEVAEAAGVNAQTLRYYHRRGLLREPQRSNGGHRLYPPETVAALRMIKAAQRLGFTLDEVADLVEAGGHRRGRSDGGLQARAAAKLAEVEQKITDLRTIRETLLQAVAAGCDDLAACATSPCCPLPFTELAEGGARAAVRRRGSLPSGR
ncbi:MerR family transcriptional regulator [Planobispora siamensis]|uniref:Mercuric resistance operon regulatory protein n=1 Tax=Planobispora siamensis TaxID=936338 RepID=A0A8J3SKL6_9ACTN|nr:MerR family transcriptional regulator [Planobispora siamensis]GIH94135.1 mercuric resistance operon regulatory protein [Planobispora siamensis]